MKNFIKILIFLILANNCYALSIDESIKSTIKNNPKVKLAYEKIIESKELINYSIGSKRPEVTGSISGKYSNSDTSTATSTSTPETLTDSYKVIITKNLYDGGINDLEIIRSKILFENEVINFKSTIQELILDAINGYLTVINYEKSLEANQKNYVSVNKVLEETKTRFDIGSATLYDFQIAEASFASSKTNLFISEQNLEISKKIFKKIVGLAARNLKEILEVKDIIKLEEINKNALENNLGLISLSNEIKNREILILKEKKSKKPSFDMTGTGLYSNGSRLDRGTESTTGSLALTLTIPLYQKGQDDSNIRKYQSQLLQSEINLIDAREELEIKIANTYKDFKINESLMESNQLIIKSVQTSIDILKEEYDIGTKTISDLVEGEENLLNANVSFLNSKRDFLLNYFELKSLDGSLIKLFDEYLPSIN